MSDKLLDMIAPSSEVVSIKVRDMRQTIMDRWLEEFIMCGWPWPVRRIRVYRDMLAHDWTPEEAVRCLCNYKSVPPDPNAPEQRAERARRNFGRAV